MVKLKQLVREGRFDKNWVDGLKTGLKLAKSVANKQGYEISFPKVDELEFEEGGDLKKNK